MHRFSIPAVVAAGALIGASGALAAAPAQLPSVNRTLTASAAVQRVCASAPDRAAHGVAISHYTAPIAGYLSARLSGPKSSDWDLVAVDRASGRRLGSSEAFGSDEVVQAWTTGGQRIDLLACRRSGRASSVHLSLDMVDVKPPSDLGTASLVRVHGPNEKLDALDNLGLDVTESRGPNWADVIVIGSKQAAALAATHLPAETRVADLGTYDAGVAAADRAYAAKVGAAGSPLPSGRTTYRTLADVQEELKALADQHPDLVKPITIGQTFQGRDIQGVEIARNVKADDGRPDFFLMGMHHAREWPTVDASMEYAEMLVKEGDDPQIAGLLRRERTTIVPIVNVDGYNSTRTDTVIDPRDNYMSQDPEDANGVGSELELGESVAPPGGVLSYRRKNCDGAIPNGNVPCELQWGIDNNRNYGNLWGGPGSSQDPTSQSFHGPGPRSEPETQAVWNYSRTHQVTALISLHTVAALVLRPPGEHTAGKAPDEDRLKKLGDAMGDATGYTSEYGFQLYDTAGTTEDDTYAAEGGYGYTIEMGPVNGPFHGPYQSAVVDQWTHGDNPASAGKGGLRAALLDAAEAAASRPDHGVITGNAPPGAVLRLHRAFQTRTSEWCAAGVDPVVTVTSVPAQAACPGGMQSPQTLKDNVDTTMTVPSTGRYTWDVNPSTRPFDGGGALIQKLADKPTREQTFTGGGPDPANNTPTQGAEDRDFTLAPDEHPDAIDINVSWTTPEDYDLEVYRKDDTKLTPVGSSGNEPGTPEDVTLTGDTIVPGATYVVRVVNFAAAVGTWTAKVGLYSTSTTVTTGHPEAYTLTCERNGQVVQSKQVYISRGELLKLQPCGAGPKVVHPDANGVARSGPPPTWPYAP